MRPDGTGRKHPRWNRRATRNLSGEPTYDNARERARSRGVPLGEKLPQSPFMGQAIKKLKLFTGRRRLNLTRPTRFNQLVSPPNSKSLRKELGHFGRYSDRHGSDRLRPHIDLSLTYYLHLPLKVAADSKFSREETMFESEAERRAIKGRFSQLVRQEIERVIKISRHQQPHLSISPHIPSKTTK